ncbi:hypothetical protein CONLIGDRAFT_640690 [Coniochaeta ligniaria NRRL 30616]|uniref:RRM domain-containing protein n=1 Tax=Coniochaeta ligniaria NRRL 30616 TaxID=1408157 RepID=A0A1J7J0J0_9PEZI|nr:hypothetical protein CONLIGDRAFT_640690 [Coniochaeta ligniaria NRRL 30616]
MSQRKHPSTGQAGQASVDGMTVQPGDVTGCYYLLVGNLQKDTGWSDIKDFLRNGSVDMDHVEVFPKTYTGWVRIYGRQNFDAAMSTSLRCVIPSHSRADDSAELFQSKPCRNRYIIPDGRNATHPTFVRNLKIAPLEAPAASTATHGAAFAAQIPPLQMSEQSGYVSMSYTNPYVTSPGTAYGVSQDYDQTDMEYNKAHPTHYHDAAPTQRTGYEGMQLYAASSRAFVDKFAAMSVVQSPPGSSDPTTTRDVSSADFKIQVKLHREGESIDQDMVMHFVRSCAPLTVQNVLRVDVLKVRSKHRGGQPNRALIVFDSAHACSMAREGMFDKEVGGMRLVQNAADDEEPAVVDAQQADAAEKPAPKEPRPPKPEGSDQRTRKEKARDRRRESEAHKKERRHGHKTAGAAHGPSGHGPPGGGSWSSSGYAAPGAPGSSSSSAAATARPMDYAAATEETTADSGGKGKEKARPLVVDGSSPVHHRQQKQQDEKKPAKQPLVVDGTTPVHKQKHGQKKHRK